jgi:hypothetical protein
MSSEGRRLDLAAIDRSYRVCHATWEGFEITLRYGTPISARVLQTVHAVLVGDLAIDGTTRFPNLRGVCESLIEILLPSGQEIPEEYCGWDITSNRGKLPITFDTLADLPLSLPVYMLSAILADAQPRRPHASRRRRRPDPPSPNEEEGPCRTT